jgi:hypothetical protein
MKDTTESMPVNHLLAQFSYLQVLDFLTTVAFLMHGVHEGNPLVRLALTYSPHPLSGLLLVKAAAIALGVYCWRAQRQRLLLKINFLFALVVVWNIAALILVAV